MTNPDANCQNTNLNPTRDSAPIVTGDYSKQSIFITPRAAQAIKSFIKEEEKTNLCLRIGVSAGGCYGCTYTFNLEEVNESLKSSDDNQEDIILDAEGIRMIVRKQPDLAYLAGATIDYEKEAGGVRFVVSNPNASNTCGCGTSFCVK